MKGPGGGGKPGGRWGEGDDLECSDLAFIFETGEVEPDCCIMRRF